MNASIIIIEVIAANNVIAHIIRENETHIYFHKLSKAMLTVMFAIHFLIVKYC